jgi:hypothetical protein
MAICRASNVRKKKPRHLLQPAAAAPNPFRFPHINTQARCDDRVGGYTSPTSEQGPLSRPTHARGISYSVTERILSAKPLIGSQVKPEAHVSRFTLPSRNGKV